MKPAVIVTVFVDVWFVGFKIEYVVGIASNTSLISVISELFNVTQRQFDVVITLPDRVTEGKEFSVNVSLIDRLTGQSAFDINWKVSIRNIRKVLLTDKGFKRLSYILDYVLNACYIQKLHHFEIEESILHVFYCVLVFMAKFTVLHVGLLAFPPYIRATLSNA